MLGGALVIAVIALAVVRFDLLDPYRAGTTHRVEVVYHRPCLNPSGLSLDERTWSSDDRAPDAWGLVDGAGSVPGTLEVVETGRGVFTADVGGSIEFVRQLGFGDMDCFID